MSGAESLLRRAGLDISRTGRRRPVAVAGATALFAAGLNPTVYGEALTSLELASRLRPELENIFLVAVVVSALMYLVGGLLGDLYGRRRVVLGSLAGLAAANIASLLGDQSAVFVVARLVSVAAVGLIIPVSIASLAIPFRRDVRAVTLSIGFGALGLGGAASAILLAIATPTVGYWPSLVLAAVAAAVAYRLAGRAMLADDLSERPRHGEIGTHVIWATGLLAVTASVIGLGGRAEPLRLTLGLVGVVAVLWALRRLRAGTPRERDAGVHLRPVAFVLVAGVILALAQGAPLLIVPKYLRYAEGYGPVASLVALVPLFVGFVVAGPVAGALSARFSPRALVAGSLVLVGLADLAIAAVAVLMAAPISVLILVALPLLAIGSGFIIGTSVRTAVIFASVPRRLPATAAALNQTSILIGTQLGVIVLTTVVGRSALAEFRATIDGNGPAAITAAVSEFERLLRAIETPEFAPIVATLSPELIEQYGAAFASGVATGLYAAGLLALAGAAITWVGMPHEDPLKLGWDYRDEARTGAR